MHSCCVSTAVVVVVVVVSRQYLDVVVMSIVEVAQERSALCNAPPTYSEPVCMPEFSSPDEHHVFNPGIVL